MIGTPVLTAQPINRGTVLRVLAETLSISDEQYQTICRAYDDLGQWLKDYVDVQWVVSVYPQGSLRIGTTNKDPWTNQFDADAVIRVAVSKDRITQLELNQTVGGWLGGYVSARQREGHALAPEGLEKKKRAWTLLYAAGFHIDVLPVVPQRPEGDEAKDPSWLTDKELRRWQPTDPRAFAAWFDRVSSEERFRKAVAKARERKVDVDDLPPLTVKTTLQQSVQLLKRHRSHMFGDDPGGIAPPSIVITTIAGRAYEQHTPDGGELEDVLDILVPRMYDYVQSREGALWVPNPGYAQENYADRFLGRPDRVRALREWLTCAADDFSLVGGGLEKTAASIDEGFGKNLGALVTKRLATEVQGAREAQRLGSAATGALTVTPPRSHRPHTFYGEPPA